MADSSLGHCVDDYVVQNAEKALPFIITADHIKKAKCKDPSKCVIAQALDDIPIVGETAEDIQVGTTCTKIRMKTGIVIRYTTPPKLGRAVRHFDETKEWNLPPGNYTLRPYTGGTYRWDVKEKRKKEKEAAGEAKGVQSVFNKGKPARRTPTRKVKSLASMKRAKKAA